jgi:hypothetical protein
MTSFLNSHTTGGLGSAVFDETHNLGKLALSDDRDAAAKCPQGGTYYLGGQVD